MAAAPGHLPSYDDLLERTGAPPGSSWGLWGDDDVLGCLNLLTPERVVRAAALVRHGRVFPLNLELDLPDPPLFGRPGPVHDVTSLAADGSIHDETLSNWNTQASAQWDGFRHVAHTEHGFYNGVADEEHGMHHWARRGIVGRGVLADVARWRESQGLAVRPGEADVISVDEIASTLDAEGTTVEIGDILLIRTGWLAWYRGLDTDARAETATGFASIGLRSGPELPRFLWDLHIAAVAGDNPAVEVFPPGTGVDLDNPSAVMDDPDGFAHRALLPLLGLPLGEMWDLDALAADCAADGVYEFLVTSAPLNLTAGVASPPNALAVK